MKPPLQIGLVLAGVVLLARTAGAQGQLVTLDFDGLTGMPDVPGSLVPAFAQLSDQFLSSQGIRFRSASGSPYVAVVSLGNGNNVIAAVDAEQRLSYDNQGNGFTIEFFLPSNPSAPAATDQIRIWISGRGLLLQVGSMQTFDRTGGLISGDFGQAGPGDFPLGNGPFPEGAVIHSAQFWGGVAWDNLAFNPALAPIPEPSTCGLFALGLLLVWWRLSPKLPKDCRFGRR